VILLVLYNTIRIACSIASCHNIIYNIIKYTNDHSIIIYIDNIVIYSQRKEKYEKLIKRGAQLLPNIELSIVWRLMHMFQVRDRICELLDI
jgi:hypothetical protein